MAVMMSDGEGEGGRDYPSLYIELCDCAGPQPSLRNPRADEHREDCLYCVEVERDRGTGE